MAGCWIFRCQRAVTRLMDSGFFHRNNSELHHVHSSSTDVAKCSRKGTKGHSLPVCDFQGTLHRSPSLFPYFMLVAFEGGSLLRALLLLISCPVLWILGVHSGASLRVMAFITFCGLRTKDVDLVARAVLPKFYLEGLHHHAYGALASAGKRAVITSMPRLMVEGFLKDYLGAIHVVGAELQVVNGCYFTGLITGSSSLASKLKAPKDLCGDNNKVDVALVSLCSPHGYVIPQNEFEEVQQELDRINNEAYVNKEEKEGETEGEIEAEEEDDKTSKGDETSEGDEIEVRTEEEETGEVGAAEEETSEVRAAEEENGEDKTGEVRAAGEENGEDEEVVRAENKEKRTRKRPTRFEDFIM